MAKRHLICSAVVLLYYCAVGAAAEQSGSSSVHGTVVSGEAPVAGAVVRVQATEHATRTDGTGRFVLSLEGLGRGPHPVTGWALGFYCSGPVLAEPGDDIVLELRRHAIEDHPEYAWLSAQASDGEDESKACSACHSRQGTDLTFDLPFDEWRRDAHAGAAENPRFLNLYLGTDTSGNRSPPTRIFVDRDYGELPIAPELGPSYRGPGYKLDFPGTAGNCSACHLPVAAVDDPYGVDPTAVTGVGAEGITCDFCHKIWEVKIDPSTGLPPPNRPGVLSFEFRRPPEGEQVFFGPFDDVAPGDDAALPLQQESRFCAPCHHGVFWGTVIYDSYGEWLRSPWADEEMGRTCQGCHMPPNGAPVFALPERGGLERHGTPIPGHRMPGAEDDVLLREAVTLTLAATMNDSLEVRVTIANDGAGHHVPTDSPLRQLILTVDAMDEGGRRLSHLSGPIVPEWGGTGDDDRAYAGRPGEGFAKILREEWTFVTPTVAYWNPTRIVADTRIPACSTVVGSWLFAAPTEGVAAVRATLLFRRAFLELEQQKGWQLKDRLMAQAEVQVANSGIARAMSRATTGSVCGP